MTSPSAEEQLRAEVRAALTHTGISQAEACRRLGLSTKHMNRMLTGRATLTLAWAEKITALCGARVLVCTTIPSPDREDRIKLDDLTSDDLDGLYDGLDRYAEVVGELNDTNIGLARQAVRAEADVARVRALHTPIQHLGQTWCSECSVRRRTGPKTEEWLSYIPHPCPTLEELDDEEPQPDAPVSAATGATEPAMITDPAYLHHLYAQAIRNTPARYPDDIATAILRVRDRHVEQLQQRLQLAQATLNAEAERDSADAAAGSYAMRAETAEAVIERVRTIVTETVTATAAGITDYDIGRHDMARTVLAVLDGTTAPPVDLAELTGDDTDILEDQ